MRRYLRLWQLTGRDVRQIFSALRRSDRPRWLLPAVLFLVFFALDPFNFLVPVLGVMDDLVLLPILIRMLAVLASRAGRSLHDKDDRVVSVQ